MSQVCTKCNGIGFDMNGKPCLFCPGPKSSECFLENSEKVVNLVDLFLVPDEVLYVV